MLPIVAIGLSFWLDLVVAGATPEPPEPPEPLDPLDMARRHAPVELEETEFLQLSARDEAQDSAVRVRVLVEPRYAELADAFADTVAATLADADGWPAAGLSFAVVETDWDITVVLAQPKTTDALCAPLRTGGTFSCGRKGRAVINARRWLHGAAGYRGKLDEYRTYVINHEVGHLLGFDHRPCKAKRRPAPVMSQQTKGLGGCVASARPSAAEIAALASRPARFE
ncbi:MAG: DUF3152 domain-containing protein [Deltaproteobacteria bacterium]|nr:DUF3152 domain-containing protein [Deltaproteobacteria bacterium]